MKKMAHEKSRAAIIAISAREVAKEHPDCASMLSRPKERIMLSARYYIIFSSASFRLYHNRPNTIRVFFLKKQPDDNQWRINLKTLLRDRVGLAPRLGPIHITGDNYHEFIIVSPIFWYYILHRRIATFLD
jgi:hypothetical protein